MTQMKAGLYLSAKNVVFDTVEKPIIGKGEALIKVSYAGICGTDMMIYSGLHPRAKAPLVMGHEFSGVIEEIDGSVSSSFSIGDRVVIEPTLSCGTCEACRAGQYHVCKTLKLMGIDKNGGFAEYVAVPINRLHRIPVGVSDDIAALAEPVAVSVHTVRRSNLKIGDTVLVLGAGPIGLLVGLAAKQAGAGEVIISDISPFRLGKAEQFGFTALDAAKVRVTEEVLKRSNGVGVDVVFEVAGNQITAQQMVETIKIQGQIVVVSVYKHSPVVDLANMHFRELSLTTTRCYSRKDFETALQMMKSGTVDLSAMISHRLQIEKFSDGFELMHNPEVSLKVLYQF